jgi:hypothetical protein
MNVITSKRAIAARQVAGKRGIVGKVAGGTKLLRLRPRNRKVRRPRQRSDQRITRTAGVMESNNESVSVETAINAKRTI